jgi:Na+/proline symporter
MSALSQRPEARWALWCGIAGALVAAMVQARAIFSSADASAVVGFVFVPLISILIAIAAGIWGLALGHVVARLRGRVNDPWRVFAAAMAALALGVLAAFSYLVP